MNSGSERTGEIEQQEISYEKAEKKKSKRNDSDDDAVRKRPAKTQKTSDEISTVRFILKLLKLLYYFLFSFIALRTIQL